MTPTESTEFQPEPSTPEVKAAEVPAPKATIAVKAKKLVTLLIGPRGKGKQQTHFLHAHESVLDVLKHNRQVTDGSLIALKSGTAEPFDMDESPYESVKDGDRIEVVPNQ